MPLSILQQLQYNLWNHFNKEENCYDIGKTSLLQPIHISVNTTWRSVIKTDVILSFSVFPKNIR